MGKLRLDLVPQEWIHWLGQLLHFGAEKYDANLWRDNPMEHWRMEASLMRHLDAYRLGEKMDAESGLPHLVAVAWNALALAYYEEKGL